MPRLEKRQDLEKVGKKMKDILKEIKKLDKEKNYKEIENIFKSLNFDKPHVRNNIKSFYENKELHMLERNLRKVRKVINYKGL